MINPLRSRQPPQRSNRQRGSIIVPAAFAIIVGIALLGSAQLGYVFYMKRELQSAADLAALSSVQVLNAIQPARCTEAMAAAKVSGIANFPTMAGALGGSEDATCARWDPTHWQNPTKLDPTGLYIFGLPTDIDVNAMHVTLTKSIPEIMPNPFGSSSPTIIRAEAVATTNAPTASFSVGSRLLRLDGTGDGLLPKLLMHLGLPANLALLDYSGLAAFSITPSTVASKLNLNVGTTTGLVHASSVKIGDLLSATLSIITNSSNSPGDQKALEPLVKLTSNILNTSIGNTPLDLFGNGTNGGLFGTISGGGKDAGLNAQVGVYDLLMATLSLATANDSAADVGLDILGTQIKVRLIAPPTIAVGGVGTRAFNAQVRLFVDINSANIPVLSSALGLLGTQIHLPIVIDLVSAMGELVALDCSQAPRRADIQVTSSLIQTCIGKFSDTTAFSGTQNCASNLKDEVLLKLLGTPIITAHYPTSDFLGQTTNTLSFSVDTSNPHALPQTQTTPASALPLGTITARLSDAVSVVSNALSPPAASSQASLASGLATQYLESTKASDGKYDIDKAAQALQGGVPPLPALQSWDLPLNCIILCPPKDKYYNYFINTVNGKNQGILGNLLGGLGLTSCVGFLANPNNYNTCVQKDLTSSLQGSPYPLSAAPVAGATCTTLLCQVLKPTLDVLTAPLNKLGALLSATLQKLTGIELGQTDVTLMSLSCAKPRLVY